MELSEIIAELQKWQTKSILRRAFVLTAYDCGTFVHCTKGDNQLIKNRSVCNCFERNVQSEKKVKQEEKSNEQ